MVTPAWPSGNRRRGGIHRDFARVAFACGKAGNVVVRSWAGADGIVTRALTGHVTEGMTAHYSTVGLDEKRAAVAGVLNLVPLPRTVDATVDGGEN